MKVVWLMGRTIMSLEMPFAGNCLRLEHFNSFGDSRLDCTFTYISFEVCNLLFKMQNEGKSNFAKMFQMLKYLVVKILL